MKIRRLRLKDYRQHGDTDIEFPDGVTAIIGRNGSGKSTILEGIGMALYGIQATRTNKDLIRRDDAPPGEGVRVELDAEVAGQAWSIVRELRGKNLTPQASLTVDGQTIVPAQAGSNDAVTQEVSARIGLDREAFFTTVFSEQKELGRLADQTPANRKRLILSMLGIDALDAAIAKARRQRGDADVRLQTLRQDLPSLDALQKAVQEQAAILKSLAGSLAAQQVTWTQAKDTLAEVQKSMDSARAQWAELEALDRKTHLGKAKQADLEQRLEQLEVQAAKAREAAAHMESLADAPAALEAIKADKQAATRTLEAYRAHERAQDEIRRLTAQAEQLPEPVPDEALAKAATARTSSQAKAAELAQELAVMRARAQQSDDHLASLRDMDAAVCPTCSRPMEEHLPRLVASLEADASQHATSIQELMAAQNDAQVAADAARQAHEALQMQHIAREQAAKAHARNEARLAELGKVAQPTEPMPDMDAIDVRLNAADDRARQYILAKSRAEHLGTVATQIAEAHTARDETATMLADAAHRIAELQASVPAREALEATHRQAAEQERAAERKVRDAELAHTRQQALHDKASNDLTMAKQRHDKVKLAVDELEHWELLVGARGGGLLDRFRSHLVGRIGPAVAQEAGRLLDRFTGGRYTEVLLDDGYQIYVTDGGVPYELARFSGGEADLVHLALRLAVSRLLLERSEGAEIRFLALDEVFGSLDEERKNLVLGALQELGGLYSQVLVVTHHEALRDALDHTLLVEETDGRATVRMHND